MALIDKFLNAVVTYCDKHDRRWTIPNRMGTGPYLERYYIFLKDRKRFPINVVIHEFKESDEDEMHDHPWWFITFIIKGRYIEHTPHGSFIRKPFEIRFQKATDLHRVELINDEPVWTFFIMGPRKREWGFNMPEGWMNWKEYIAKKRAGTI